MKLTIGMPSYNNYSEVWMTIQALRLYHDLTDVELLVVDNYGCDHIKNFIAGWAGDKVKYVRWTEAHGTAAAKNRVFEEASGEWVFCIDSHIMLMPGTVARLKEYLGAHPDCRDLLQGPIIWDSLAGGADSFNTEWSGGMWGRWHNLYTDRSLEPYEIPMMGMGLFGCRKDAWLGFNPAFRGFGGEEGYIHEKYRKAGYKTICLPWLQWLHQFRAPGTIQYTPLQEDKVRNYTLGFLELGLDLKPLYDHFGPEQVTRYAAESAVRSSSLYDFAVNTQSDINEHLPLLASLVNGKNVVEFGVRDGNSTTAFLRGMPKSLVSYDIFPCSRADVLAKCAQAAGIDFRFELGSSVKVELAPTDILFIDTIHTEAQLAAELARHADKITELIILHDTETFGERGEDGGKGLNFAVRAFLAKTDEWAELVRYAHNNGLTILHRTKGGNENVGKVDVSGLQPGERGEPESGVPKWAGADLREHQLREEERGKF
jgi:glycosyltransferase involved in cell wall biosynthesis